MPYQIYSLDWLERLVNQEIIEGVDLLSSSYLSEKYKRPLDEVQLVLTDMASASKLKRIYRVLCSGEHQNYDVDLEVENPEDIPRHSVTCHTCGDRYKPSEDNILVYFSPTDAYKKFLSSTIGSHAG